MPRKRKIRICWPNPDSVCLQGGCIHCADAEKRGVREVLATLNDAQKADFLSRTKG